MTVLDFLDISKAFLWTESQSGCSRTTRLTVWLAWRASEWRSTQVYGRLMIGLHRVVESRRIGLTHHSALSTGASMMWTVVAGLQCGTGLRAMRIATRGCGLHLSPIRLDKWSGCKMITWSITIVLITRGSLKVYPWNATLADCVSEQIQACCSLFLSFLLIWSHVLLIWSCYSFEFLFVSLTG